jgi:hypothetical protein
MRAHLLQTTTNERGDALPDRAANDEDFMPGPAQAMQAPAPVAIAIAPAPTCDNDDYWLGGYAGI